MINFMFRALTTDKRLMPGLLAAGAALPDKIRDEVAWRVDMQQSRP
jgi:hypothetical protein